MRLRPGLFARAAFLGACLSGNPFWVGASSAETLNDPAVSQSIDGLVPDASSHPSPAVHAFLDEGLDQGLDQGTGDDADLSNAGASNGGVRVESRPNEFRGLRNTTIPAGRTQPFVREASTDPFLGLVCRGTRKRRAQEKRTTIERYVLATDDRAFLFEDGPAKARIKFLCGDNDQRFECIIDPNAGTSEVYELVPTRGPRGDIIYRNMTGETLLRIASYGGATVFWPDEASGSAASKSFGDQKPLGLAHATLDDARRRAMSASAILSAETGAPILFSFQKPEIPSDENADASVLADAVVMAGKALHGVAADATWARILGTRIKQVYFRNSGIAAVSLSNNSLIIDYNDGAELEGRPSSASIRQFLETSL